MSRGGTGVLGLAGVAALALAACTSDVTNHVGPDVDPTAVPTAGPTVNPADCGNGVLDVGESCDGSLLNGQNCANLGFNTGELSCAAGCTIDSSGCHNTSQTATRLYYEGFETESWTSNSFSSVDVNLQDRTQNRPKAGSWALRGNGLPSGSVIGIRRDGIATETNPGGVENESNSILESHFGPASGKHAGQLFLRYWLRFDASHWRGTAGQSGFWGKFAYITDYNYPGIQGGVWFNHMPQGGSPTEFFIDGNGDNATQPFHQSWISANWGTTWMDMNHAPGGTDLDGQWHKIEILFDFDQDVMTFWADGYPATRSSVPDGKIPMHPDFAFRGIQFMHVSSNNGNVDASTDNGDEKACGWQIDELEAWDGIP